MKTLLTVNAAWNVLNFRRPLVQALQEAGHSLTVLAPQDPSSAQLQALGCEFVPLQMDVKGLSPRNDLRLIRDMGQQFRQHRPAVVLSFTIKNNIFGAIAAKRSKTPFIPNVTGLGTAFLSGGLLQRIAETLYRFAFRGLPVVFFQNADDRELFLSRGLVSPAQARLLPGSGIDLTRFAATDLPGQAPVFLLISRLIRDKGVLEYVEAARIVRQSHPQARFQLLGPIGSENRTAIAAETVAQWQSEGIVEYLGETDDVRPYIAAADCVVLPSYREGAPRTLIEAAAMARPLITTDVPGCRSVVDGGVSGLLCQVKNAQSLARACTQMVQMSPQARQQMGQAGRAKMEREFDQKIVVSAYLDAIAEVTGQGQ